MGLLTTGSPHQGSELGRIYTWLTANPRHEFDGSGAEITTPTFLTNPDGPHIEIDQPLNWQDWSVTDWLRSSKAVLDTFKDKPPLDVRRPAIGELADNSPDIAALDGTSAVASLPGTNVSYGEIVYDEVPLGNLAPGYSVFDGIAPSLVVYPLTDGARAFILGNDSSGSANTATTWRGDGLVPAPNQLFTTLQGFVGIRIKPLVNANVPQVVLHTDEPAQVPDLLTQLRIIAPGWFP
jgi:hypothetical protein